MTKDEIIENIRYLYVEKEFTYPEIKDELSQIVGKRKDLMAIIIKTLEKLDIKRCSRGKDCINPKGHILSRSEFHQNGEKRGDGLKSQCKFCNRFRDNYRKADDKKKRLMEEYFALNSEEEKINFIIKLYTEELYPAHQINGITLVNKAEIDQVIRSKNIKVCVRKENCKSPNGCVQTPDNFRKDRSTADGLNTTCNDCIDEDRKKEHYAEYRKKRKDLKRFYDDEYNIRSAKYDTYQEILSKVHEIRKDPEDETLIQVRCKLCNKWFNPTNLQVRMRNTVITGQTQNLGTENNFYCSETCKNSCSVYNSKSIDVKNSRLQGQLRKFVIEEFGEPDHCDVCNGEFSSSELILHHKYPVAVDFISEADIDNLIWTCEDCHDNAHNKPGCSYVELRDFVC